VSGDVMNERLPVQKVKALEFTWAFAKEERAEIVTDDNLGVADRRVNHLCFFSTSFQNRAGIYI
jgi:hypothetical protein